MYSSPTTRNELAKESFLTASECIGELKKEMSLFAITRGQFSMIDALLYVVSKIGQCNISVWTWTIADYEIQRFNDLKNEGLLDKALLIVDRSARSRNLELIESWQAKFGKDSVRWAYTHAKIATVFNDNWRFLLRGSMNLNCNPHFEQFDLSESCKGFDLVQAIEKEFSVLSNDFSDNECRASSKIGEGFGKSSLAFCNGLKQWKI